MTQTCHVPWWHVTVTAHSTSATTYKPTSEQESSFWPNVLSTLPTHRCYTHTPCGGSRPLHCRVKKFMEHEVEGSSPRGRPKKTWKEVVREDCQARKLNKEDAMDRCKWRKMIKEARWSGWVWVGECFFWYRPTRVVPDLGPLNGRCCCCTGNLDWYWWN